MFHRKRKILCACVHCEYILYILLNTYVVQLYAKPRSEARQLYLLAGGTNTGCLGLAKLQKSLWWIFIEGGRTLHLNLPL